MIRIPKVGDEMLAPPTEDYKGGPATVSEIITERSINIPGIKFKEQPSCTYNLKYLLEMQDELKERFGYIEPVSNIKIDKIMEEIYCLTDSERVELLDDIKSMFCTHCGLEHQTRPGCQCDNDE